MPTITKDQFLEAKSFIKTDITREIVLARATHSWRQPFMKLLGIKPLGGGNLLSALGLLCYTEFGGWLKHDLRYTKGWRAGQAKSTDNFNAFFDDLGPEYRAFRACPHKVYKVFRCGMAHQYFINHDDFTIYMMDGGRQNIGIAHDPQKNAPTGHYSFVVELYLRDLSAALDTLDTLPFPLQRP